MPDEKKVTSAPKLYRLKDGMKHVGLKPGDTTELTDNQALAFSDKFELVGGGVTGLSVPNQGNKLEIPTGTGATGGGVNETKIPK